METTRRMSDAVVAAAADMLRLSIWYANRYGNVTDDRQHDEHEGVVDHVVCAEVVDNPRAQIRDFAHGNSTRHDHPRLNHQCVRHTDDDGHDCTR